MPFTMTPTYRHSRCRAAVALARHGDQAEAARIGRIRVEQLQAWIESDTEFQRIYQQTLRRVRRQQFRRLLNPLESLLT